MPNIIKVSVDGVEDLLNAGAYGAGAIVQLQSAPAVDGVFGDEGTAPLVTGVRIYTLYDTDGVSTTWYRTRYENAGGTIVSEWSDPFQVGGEEGGLICSLYDVKQALGKAPGDTSDDEEILEHIRRIGAEIIGYTGQWFLRTPSAGTAEFVLDVEADESGIWIPQGIAELTQLEVAGASQPTTGGTYTIVPSADWMLRPLESGRPFGWPATQIVFADYPSGGSTRFYAGQNTVRLTGALGWDKVPADVEGIAERAVVASFLTKGSDVGGVAVLGPTGRTTVLRHISPADRGTLDRYRRVVLA